MGSIGEVDTTKAALLQSKATEIVVSKLASEFPGQVFQQDQEGYQALRDSYWSGNQKALQPRCFFQPHRTSDVERAVGLCAEANCPFGVKSGGHGHFAGVSCLDGGVQLDLSKLNSIHIDHAKGTVRVGTGSTWRAVYTVLQKEGLIALGGRSADVGVGGFLVGGGISFYAAQHGWGIDNVHSFEVVLGNGIAVVASRTSEPDLFRALRGGGSNFGVITSYELQTYPYRGMWGGRTVVEPEYVGEAIDAWGDFISRLESDPKGHTIVIFYWDTGKLYVMQYLAYTEPIPDLPMFDRLRAVPKIESQGTGLGIVDYTDLAADIADLQGGNGSRVAVATMTINLDLDLLHYAYETFSAEVKPNSERIKGCLEFHALPRPIDGSNVYGLPEGDGPYVTLMIGLSNVDPNEDGEVIAIQNRILHQVEAEARRRNLYHQFLFKNYAGEFQDVLSSYGVANNKLLAEASSRYDPEQVFQRLLQGSFKLKGASPTLRR